MTSFNLVQEIPDKTIDGPAPAEVKINLCGRKLAVEKGDHVKAGAMLAKCVTPLGGDVHASIAGEVTEATAACVHIKGGGKGTVKKVKVDGDADKLKGILASLGIDMTKIGPADTLIINALNPEPLVSTAQQILLDHADVAAAGLEIVKKIVSPKNIYLAAMEGTGGILDGATIREIEPLYPVSVDELAIKAVTGKENPEGVLALSMDRLFAIGTVARTGLPLTDRLVTVGGKNYCVKFGTPVEDLLLLAGVTTESEDRIILGGPMRGDAQFSITAPVDKNTTAVLVIKKGEFPPVSTDACINCGECTRKCPARLQAALIARYAEFGLFEGAVKLDIDLCFECGICAFWCPARRPLLQYIRFAKSELKILEAAKAEAEKAATEAPAEKEKKVESKTDGKKDESDDK